MVLVTVRVRPKSGYHRSNTIQKITLDSSSRLEELLLKSTGTTSAGTPSSRPRPVAASSHAALFFNGQELPLNSTIASHNLEDNAILEGCNSPFMSAAISSLIKDLNNVKSKIPSPNERNKTSLKEVLQLPDSSSPNYDLSLDDNYWSWKSWKDDSLEKRIICLATVKKHLQRDDRNNAPLQPCETIQDLYKNFQPVWARGGGTRGRANRANYGGATNGNRLKFGNLGLLLQPTTKKRPGKPSTLWLLLETKLEIQKNTCQAASHNEDRDPLEEFIIIDELRLGTGTSTAAGANNSTSGRRRRRSNNTRSDATSAACGHNNNSQGLDSNEAIDISDDNIGYQAETPSPSRSVTASSSARGGGGRPKHYTPEYGSGPFAVLSTLVESMYPDLAVSDCYDLFTRCLIATSQDRSRRELSLTEEKLKYKAQRRCRSNLYDKSLGPGGRNAFACMEGLMARDMVRRERGNLGTLDDSNIVKWSLMKDGEELGKACLQYEKAVNEEIPISFMRTGDQQRLKNKGLTLIVDDREDSLFRERLKRFCADGGIPTEERELPAGDYLFITKNGEEEKVVPLVIERKSWSDLADSVLGRGRSRQRLECVKIDDAIAAANDTIENQFQQWTRNPQCSKKNCQLCKMKRSGCTQVLFIVEGGWCSNRDGQRVQKCTSQKRCQSCKVLADRHRGATQDLLQKTVLHRLQVQHNCHIHYTNGYNETMSSLLMIRELLLEGNDFASTAFSKTQEKAATSNNTAALSSLSYKQFCTNARSTEAVPVCDFNQKKQDVIDYSVEVFASQLNDKQTPFQQSIFEMVGAPVLAQQSSERKNIEVPSLSEQSTQQEKSKNGHENVNRVIVIDLSDDESVEKTNGSKNAAFGTMNDFQDDYVEIIDGPAPITPETIDLMDSDDDLDEAKVMRSSADKTSSKIKTNTTASCEQVFLQERPLVILRQMQEYSDKMTKDINNVWKKAYNLKMTVPTQGDMDIYTHSIQQLKNLKADKKFPLVRRESLLFATLYIQIKLGILLRIATQKQYADGLSNLWTKSCRTNDLNSTTTSSSSSSSTNVAIDRTAAQSSTMSSSGGTAVQRRQQQPPIHDTRHSSEGSSSDDDLILNSSGLTTNSSNNRNPTNNRFRSNEQIRKPPSRTSKEPPSTTKGRNHASSTKPKKLAAIDDKNAKLREARLKRFETPLSQKLQHTLPDGPTRSLSSHSAEMPISASFQERLNSNRSQPMTKQKNIANNGVSTKRKMTCGACGGIGHNRTNAVLCPEYNSQKERELRAKKAREKEETAMKRVRIH